MITLGQKVHDGITGFEGIAIAKTEWLNGCVRFGVQSSELHDGVPTEAQWFDEGQLSLVSTEPLASTEPHVITDEEALADLEGRDRPGGPRKDPKPLRGG